MGIAKAAAPDSGILRKRRRVGTKKIRAHICVNGIVQGVGFRPFIHRQITEYALTGWIRNTSEGAELEIEGEETAVDRFVRELWTKHPPLAVVESVETEKTADLKHYGAFSIIESHAMQERNTLISPDIGICEDCMRELLDPQDRRYRYPFINCTNCGPRFTIIRDVPYDRKNTSMGRFPMCPDCAAEYGEITNRRYHAQPDCCPVCGPHLQLLDAEGREIAGEAIEAAIRLLQDGKILAVKGLGGFHLACRCDDAEITRELRRRKRRDEKPFAIMCRDAETARRYCEISEEEEAALTGFRKPIVLLKKKKPDEMRHISENGRVGVMLPYTPTHVLLLGGEVDCLVMTSANLSDTPIVFRDDEALEKLHGIADAFLLNDREIVTRCDDSLLYIVDGREYPLRRSRGYVPSPLTLPRPGKRILACGAEQKASFCLSKGRYAFQSQHIGDLKNLETLDGYEQQIRHFQRMFDVKPEQIVCDLHPDYLSTAYAENRAEEDGIPLLQVQHHWAHMASCMADNRVETPCIGVIWDGTGFGTDGTVWGGEFLAGDFTAFARRGSLRPVKLPGGDRVTRELWRVGAALLEDAGIPAETVFPKEQAELVRTVLTMGVNCPTATSMGRLFDGVSAILGIRREATYEGQGAVLLEAAATPTGRCYPFEVTQRDGRWEFDFRPMITAMVDDVRGGVPAGESAAAFMNTLAEMAAEICGRIRQETGLAQAALSGGTFQNLYLLTKLTGLLRERGFTVLRHSRVSANDEGISFGQLAISERSK